MAPGRPPAAAATSTCRGRAPPAAGALRRCSSARRKVRTSPAASAVPSLVETWFGTFLFYSSNGSGGDQDIYVSRLGRDGHFGPGKVVEELSTEFEDIMPNVREREDGSFEIVFSSNRPTWGRGQAAFGAQDVYYSRGRGGSTGVVVGAEKSRRRREHTPASSNARRCRTTASACTSGAMATSS